FQKAIQLRPQYWGGYNWLGSFYYNAARYDDAARMFTQMIALAPDSYRGYSRSEEHTSGLQSLAYLVCRLLLEKKNGSASRFAIYPWSILIRTLNTRPKRQKPPLRREAFGR